MYAVGLALCTFANISSEEMSRDLCDEIEKLLGSSNTYIRKKVEFSFYMPYNRSHKFCCIRLLYVLYAWSEKFPIFSNVLSRNRKAFSPTETMGYFYRASH